MQLISAPSVPAAWRSRNQSPPSPPPPSIGEAGREVRHHKVRQEHDLVDLTAALAAP